MTGKQLDGGSYLVAAAVGGVWEGLQSVIEATAGIGTES